MNGIPEAPWIRYADTNGSPTFDTRTVEKYRVVVEENDKSTTVESFNNHDSALNFYNQCVEEDVISASLKMVYGDGDDYLMAYYEREG